MSLRSSVVDVFLKALDQAPGDRSGPTGRLTSLKNAIVTQFQAGNGKPQRVVVKQRNGFTSLTVEGHSSTTGADESPAWANPELLSSLGSQLLSIANAIPRVYDGTDWTHYGDVRAVSNVLTESVFHTSQRTIQAQDSAWKGGVTCSVWAENVNPENNTDIVSVGFRGDDGTWIRPPFVAYDPQAEGDNVVTMGRCVADKDEDLFWVVVNAQDDDHNNVFRVFLYDFNGQQIAVDNTQEKIMTAEPGYWDIVAVDGGGVFLAQPLHDPGDATDGVEYTLYTQVAGSVTITTSSDTDVHCRGKLAWITNDLPDGFCYLATIGLGEEPSGKLWAYQVDPTNPDPFVHEYDFEVFPAVDTLVDSLIGFTKFNFNPDAADIPDVIVSFTSLHTADSAQVVGPPFDPQLRYSEVWSCDFADNHVFIRQNDYTCQVSRAFKHDDEYYSINYYQSGSGRLLGTTQIDVDFTAGDYMYGSQDEPIEVRSGDFTTGSPFTISKAGQGVISPSAAFANDAITGTDTVEQIVSGNDLFSRGVPSGTVVLRWTFANFSPADPTLIAGGRLVVAATTTPADGTWDVLGTDATGSFPNSVYTYTTDITGNPTGTPTTFTTGNFQIDSMTSFQMVAIGPGPAPIDLLDPYVAANTAQFFVGGDMVITGNSGANNGTKTIARVIVSDVNSGTSFGQGPRIWITTGSEFHSTAGFVAVISPLSPNRWAFAGEVFDDADINSTLVVAGTARPGNEGEFTITDGSFDDVQVTASASVAEIFASPLPTVLVHNPDDKISYTFFLQDLDVDYSLKGAYLVVASDTLHPQNNGTYIITDIDPDPSHHIVYARPANGLTGQRNQFFIPDNQTITIFRQTNVNPEYQPCWFMVPLTGSQPVVGRWEYGIAYADWRIEGNNPFFGPNGFPLHVTSMPLATVGRKFVLPYRAISFTVGQTLVTASGQVINGAVSSQASTVGTKQFTLANTTGQATRTSGSLLLPGPMCGEFTASGFHENGVNVGFEAPFLVSQQVSDNGVGLKVGGTYQVVAVAEISDEDGDRVFSVVSPALNFQLNGDNNSATYGGRLFQPLDTDGQTLIDKHFGVTNWRLVGISLYRTAYQDDVPTTEHHKITLDLNVNGLAPVSDSNDSGFTFPTEFTWQYRDENLDAAILPTEVLYTDKGYLPRFPAPAERQGVLWKDREWVIGYDGAVWMSGEEKEGDATWFFPLYRFPQAIQDEPIALAPMDDYLLVFCRGGKSVWYIPAAQFPNATGREGTLPAMVKTTFTNGCTGFAIPVQAGVAYSSTAGGVWLVTRGLQNQFLSQPIQDDFEGVEVTGLALDEHQRLAVSTGTSLLFVYDQVVQLWSVWNIAAGGVETTLLSDVDGVFSVQSSDRVLNYDPTTFADTDDGSALGVPLDVTLSSLNFSNVRGLKAVWEMQLVGEYKGPHHINAVISYPDDDPDNPTVFPDPADGPFTPDPTAVYLLAINPMIEQASSYGVRVFADFDGIETPGNSFELELISCEVGVDSTVGVNKFVDSRRIPGAT